MNHTRITLAIAGAALMGMATAAIPAAAHGGDRDNRAEKPAKADRGKVLRRGFRGCTIADDRMLTAENHAGLGRLKERLDARVADERITRERADRILNRRSKKVTIRVTVRTARWAPVFDLFGVEGDTHKAKKTALREMRRDAGGMRALLEDKNLEISDLRTARREGRKAGRTARRDLCSSGRVEQPAPSEETAPSTEDAAPAAA